jgi:MFS family permease
MGRFEAISAIGGPCTHSEDPVDGRRAPTRVLHRSAGPGCRRRRPPLCSGHDGTPADQAQRHATELRPLGLGGRARTLDSLRLHRNYRLYFVGQFISMVGTWLQGAAQAWMILGLTHSALAVGLVGFWQFAPYTVLGVVGGAISDRLDPRRTLIASQVALGACGAGLAAFALAGGRDVAVIYAIAALRGLVMVINSPSQQALMIQMVGRDELANAISLNSGLANATRVVGPGLAGLIIAAAGVGICFSLDALSYGAVVAALALMRPSEFFPLRRAERAASLLSELVQGLAYAIQTPRVWLPLSVLTVISTLGINFSVLLPLLAAQTLHAGPGVYGLITSLFGVGALCGALASAALGRTGWGLLLASGAAFSVCELVLAPQHQLAAVILLLVATGAAYTLYTAATNIMVQLAAPDALQGRVAGLYSYVFLGTAPAGALIAGGLSAAGGTARAFGVAGVAGLVAVGAAVALAGALERRSPPEWAPPG